MVEKPLILADNGKALKYRGIPSLSAELFLDELKQARYTWYSQVAIICFFENNRRKRFGRILIHADQAEVPPMLHPVSR